MRPVPPSATGIGSELEVSAVPFDLIKPALREVAPVPPEAIGTGSEVEDSAVPLDVTKPAGIEVAPVPPEAMGSVPATPMSIDWVLEL